jgi:hypothetical protein
MDEKLENDPLFRETYPELVQAYSEEAEAGRSL